MSNYLANELVSVARVGYGKVKENQVEKGLVIVELENGKVVKVLEDDIDHDLRQTSEDIDAAKTVLQDILKNKN